MRLGSFYLGLIALLTSSIIFSTHAQNPVGVYCNVHAVSDIAWSPDGERLAVMTLHGVLIYDTDLGHIRSIEAPTIDNHVLSFTGPVWSPDGEWIILPQRTSPEKAAQGRYGWAKVNAQTGEIRGMPYLGSQSEVLELVWSPDNRYILVLMYQPSMGLQFPYSQVGVVLGIADEGFSPYSQRYEDLQLTDVRWESQETFTAQNQGIRLTFDAETLEPVSQEPLLRGSWWVDSPDGNRAAAQKPDTNFYVREEGVEEVRVILDIVPGDRPIQPVTDIIWMSNSEQLIGIYDGFRHRYLDYPELSPYLHGTVVDALNATETDTFTLEAEGEIEAYDVSVRGDRIALVRDEIVIELWNPLTEERITTLDVPPLPIMDSC